MLFSIFLSFYTPIKSIEPENIIEKEILPKAGKRERRRVAIYAIIAFVLIVPAIIFRREYIEAKKRIKRRKR